MDTENSVVIARGGGGGWVEIRGINGDKKINNSLKK